jgi:hypothetical protein
MIIEEEAPQKRGWVEEAGEQVRNSNPIIHYYLLPTARTAWQLPITFSLLVSTALADRDVSPLDQVTEPVLTEWMLCGGTRW